MMFWTFSLLTLVGVGFPPLAHSQEQRRYALVIGNSEYEKNSFLPNAVNDAEAMEAAFEKLGFETTKLLNCGSKTEMEAAIDEFVGSLQENDTCFLFYAGHGLSFEGKNYLVPTKAEIKTCSSRQCELC